MIPAVPSRHRGAHFVFTLLLILLAASNLGPAPAVLARMDIQVATEGDPGDGTLSPAADAAGSGGGSWIPAGSADIPADFTYVMVPDLWLAPVAVVPWYVPLDAAARLRAVEIRILAPVRPRGWHDAR